MDASDMGLPDDELLERLKVLVQTGFNFDDLVAAEQQRQSRMDEIATVIDQHDRGPFKGMKLPPIKLGAEEIPTFVDQLIEHGFHHPGSTASLAIRLTDSVRRMNYPAAKLKMIELLAAMAESDDDELTIKLVTDVCKRELE